MHPDRVYATAVASRARLRRRGPARLYPTRHDHAVRRAGCGHGRGTQSRQAPPPASGVFGFSMPHRPQRSRGVGRASGSGQLRDVQARQGESLAGKAASLSPSRHADLCVLAQSGRALVRYHHPARDPTGFLFLREAAHQQIECFVNNYNINTCPFVWTATAKSIIAKVERLGALISGTGH